MEVIVEDIVTRFRKVLSISGDNSDAIKVVETEVLALVSSGQVIENVETVTLLERRIRERITSGYMGSAKDKLRAAAEADEWAWLDALAAATAKEEEKRKAGEVRRQKLAAQEELRQYTNAVQQRKKAAYEAKRAEMARVDADVKAWRQAEVAVRDARRNAAQRLRGDRQAQLDQLHARQELARLLRHAAEARTAETIRQEAKKAVEADKIARAKARAEMEAVYEGNLAAERTREEARAAEQALDLRYMEQYNQMLSKQDADRAAQLERVHAIQAAQAVEASTRPPVKRWIAAEIIDKQAADSEAGASKKESEKAAAAAAAARACADEVSQQLKERRAARAAAAVMRTAERHAAAVEAAAAAAEEAQRAKRIAEKSRRLKEGLDSQLTEKKRRAPLGSMNENERKLNAKLLKNAREALAAAGKSGVAAR